MASAIRRATINIIDDIIENAEEYDFYQAVRLLNRLNTVDTANYDKSKPRIKIRPELNLDYPHADIDSIKKKDNSSYEIITTFFGLYGVSSPLPGYFTEELLDEEWEERDSTREFLDVIHQHMYPLLYRSWLKYRFSLNAIEESGEQYWEIMFSILGLPEKFRQFGDLSGQFLKYSGIIGQRPKTQLGLKTILTDFLNPIEIEIEPCVKRNVTIVQEQRCTLSQANITVGENSVIGQQVADRSGKFRILIGPVVADQFQELLNQKKYLRFIRTITDLFMVQPLQCEIVIKLEEGAVKPISLGTASFGTLGQSTWLVEEINNFEFSVVLH